MRQSQAGLSRGTHASPLVGLVDVHHILDHWRQAITNALGAEAWARYSEDFAEIAQVAALRHPTPGIFLGTGGAHAAVLLARLFEAERTSPRPAGGVPRRRVEHGTPRPMDDSQFARLAQKGGVQ